MADDMIGQDQNIPATQNDILLVKNDVLAVRDDVLLVKNELKNDLLSVRSELLDGQRKMMIVLSQVVGTLAEMKVNVATKAELRELRSEVLQRMDGFAGSLDDFRLEWAHHREGQMRHEDRLDDHERRLGKIESRRQ